MLRTHKDGRAPTIRLRGVAQRVVLAAKQRRSGGAGAGLGALQVLAQAPILCAVALWLRGLPNAAAALGGLACLCKEVASTAMQPSVRAQLLLSVLPARGLLQLVRQHLGSGSTPEHGRALGHGLSMAAAALGLDPGSGDVGAAARALGVHPVAGPSALGVASAGLRIGALRALDWMATTGAPASEELWHALFQLVGDELLPGLAGMPAERELVARAVRWTQARHGRERACALAMPALMVLAGRGRLEDAALVLGGARLAEAPAVAARLACGCVLPWGVPGVEVDAPAGSPIMRIACEYDVGSCFVGWRDLCVLAEALVLLARHAKWVGRRGLAQAAFLPQFQMRLDNAELACRMVALAAGERCVIERLLHMLELPFEHVTDLQRMVLREAQRAWPQLREAPRSAVPA